MEWAAVVDLKARVVWRLVAHFHCHAIIKSKLTPPRLTWFSFSTRGKIAPAGLFPFIPSLPFSTALQLLTNLFLRARLKHRLSFVFFFHSLFSPFCTRSLGIVSKAS